MTQSNRLSFLVLTVGLSLVSAAFTACGDKTALGSRGSGGTTSVAVPGTGGDVEGTVPVSVGGSTGQAGVDGGGAVGTGGASLGTGGMAVGAGGASIATGGVGGGTTLASGGAGGGIIGGCRYPSCLWNLVKDCLVIGQCTEESNPNAAIQQKLCCSNGVTETVSVLTQSSGALSGTVTVTKGGAACYTVAFNGRFTSGNDTNATYAWIDPSGQVAVKGFMSDSKYVTLSCPNGETEQFSVDCSPDGSDEAIKTPGRCE
jgi:hypothetical protein